MIVRCRRSGKKTVFLPVTNKNEKNLKNFENLFDTPGPFLYKGRLGSDIRLLQPSKKPGFRKKKDAI